MDSAGAQSVGRDQAGDEQEPDQSGRIREGVACA